MLRVLVLLFAFVVALFAAVNINTATVKELSTLKGIGEKKAEAIVSYREANGKFKSINELANVKGIGEKMLQNLKDQITTV